MSFDSHFWWLWLSRRSYVDGDSSLVRCIDVDGEMHVFDPLCKRELFHARRNRTNDTRRVINRELYTNSLRVRHSKSFSVITAETKKEELMEGMRERWFCHGSGANTSWGGTRV